MTKELFFSNTTFNFDLIFGPFLTIWAEMGYFWGWGTIQTQFLCLINDFILYAPFYSEVSEHHLVVGAMYNEAIAQGFPIFFLWSKFAENCSQFFNFSKYILFAR